MQNQGFDHSINQAGSDFALYDFINDTNFDQFIDLIRGENSDPVAGYTPNYNCDLMYGGGIMDNQFGPSETVDKLNSNTSTFEQDSILDSLPPISGDFDIDDGENDEDDSSINTTTPTKNGTGDRSRTLVSERRRRSRMKEKLYALRSLVPNITKMDKASIVGDAVSYVQDLQMQAKKLKSEIADIEASLSGGGMFQILAENTKKPNNFTEYKHPILKTHVLQMDAFQVEEKEYYVRLVCSKGEGVAVALHKVLESLPFKIKSSNFSTVSERIVLTFTVNVNECREVVNLSTLKLLVTGTLISNRFEIKML